MKNASLVLLLVAGTLSVSAKPPKDGPQGIVITTLSTRADHITGGDVLVEMAAM